MLPLLIPLSTQRRLMRLALRMIPLLPAPELYDVISDLLGARKDIHEKVDQAQKAMTETIELVNDLELELRERAGKLEHLTLELNRYEALARQKQEEVRPIIEQLEIAANRGKATERTISFVINIAAGAVIFVLGLVASPWISHIFGLKP